MTSFGTPVPILRSVDEARTRDFYLTFLGFELLFEHRFEPGLPLYLGVRRGVCELHLSEHYGDATPGAAVRIAVDDVVSFAAGLRARAHGNARPGEPEATPWGDREITLADPAGNRLTFFTPAESAPAAASEREVATPPAVASIFDGFPVPSASALLGWHVRAVDAHAGTIEVGFLADERFLNPAGDVQGGFVAAMLDDTVGPGVFAMTDGAVYAPTVDLTVSFIRPARPGRFVGRGRVVNLGRTIVFLEGELFDADGVLVARATATARAMAGERAK